MGALHPSCGGEGECVDGGGGGAHEEGCGGDGEVPCVHDEVLLLAVASDAVVVVVAVACRMSRFRGRVSSARCCSGCCAHPHLILTKQWDWVCCVTHQEKVRPLRQFLELVEVGVVAASEDVAGTFVARNRSCCTGRSSPRSCTAADPSAVACPFVGDDGGAVGTWLVGGPAVDASCVGEGKNCGGILASHHPCTACAWGPGQNHPLG